MQATRHTTKTAQRARGAAELLRLLCSTEAVRSALQIRIASLAKSVPGALLYETARAHRVLGIARLRLEDVGGPELKRDFEVLSALALEAQQSYNTALLMTTMATEATLRSGAVPCLPLKGVALGARIYGDAAVRTSSDVDVLVRRQDLSRAVQLLHERLAYMLPTDEVGADGFPLLHFRMERPAIPAVELHWRIHWYEERLGSELISSAPDGRLPAELELVALLVFYARDGFAGLRLAADVAAWWDLRGSEVELVRLDQVLRRFPELQAAVRASAVVAERVVGVPLGPLAVDERSQSWSIGLADWRQDRSVKQRTADIALVNVALGPPGHKLRLAVRELFPSSGRTAAWAPGRSRSARLQHPLRRAARWSLACARLATRSRRMRHPTRGG